jgi:Holliday junction resolvase RusA-like endonuclease
VTLTPFLAFDVVGIPKGQPRPRAVRRGAHAGVYDPGTAKEWKGAVAAAALGAMGTAPLSCPLALAIFLRFPRPQRLAKVSPSSLLPHTAKPDADNCAKAIMDALTGIAWVDDAQICSLSIVKEYADMTGSAGALIQILKVDA